MTKLHLVLVTLLIFLFTGIKPVLAVSQEKYYSDLMKSWGYKSDIIFASNTRVEDINKNGVNNIIIICDQIEAAECSYDRKEGVVFNSNDITDEEGLRVYHALESPSESRTKIHTIPQILFTEPKYQVLVEAYFKSLSQSDAALESNSNTFTKTLEALNVFSDSFLFHAFIYSVLICALVVILRRYISTFIRNPKAILTRELLPYFFTNDLRITLRKIYSILPSLLITLVLLYVPIIVIAVIRWQVYGGIQYALSVALNTFYPSGIYQTIISGDKTALLLSVYNYAICATVLLFFLPELFRVMSTLTQRSRRIRVKTSIIKWGIIILPPSIAVLLVTGQVHNVTLSISFVIGFLAIAMIQMKRRKIIFPELFSRKERRRVIIILVLVTAWSLFAQIQGKRYPNHTIIFQNLVRSDSRITTLPYTIDTGPYQRFINGYHNGEHPIFVNNYLIFHPIYKTIRMRNIGNYTHTPNMIIVAKDETKFLRRAVEIPDLINNMPLEQFSSLFVINGFSYFDASSQTPYTYMGKITVNCRLKPNPGSITIDAIYTYTTHTGGTSEAQMKNYPVMDFPGCKNDSKDTDQFLFILPTEFASRNTLASSAFRISAPENGVIIDMALYKNGVAIPVSFFPRWQYGNSHYNVAFTNPTNSVADDITVYSVDAVQEMEFQRTESDSQNVLDLSPQVNRLLDMKLLPDHFLLWSDKIGSVLRSKFDE